MFHDIHVYSKKSGITHRFCGIGATRADAEATIRNYNLKCDNFDELYELRHPNQTPENAEVVY